MICACGSSERESLQARCAQAADTRRETAAGLCFAGYLQTRDAATGARAARALQRRDGTSAVVERIAGEIGDSEAGADAWLAAGLSRGRQGDFAGAVTAHLRASAHRGVADGLGKLHDAVALLAHHQGQGDYQAASQQAVTAYHLARSTSRPDDRAVANLNVAGLLVELGNLAAAKVIVDETVALVLPTSRSYGYVLKLQGQIELDADHWKIARTALRKAHDVAIARDDRGLAFDTQISLVDTALRLAAADGPQRAGELDEAEQLLGPPIGADALPNDRAVDAYFRGQLAIARGRHAEAARLIERALLDAPEAWIAMLEAVHGSALRQAGDGAAAERALVRAIEAVERKRAALELDTLKSWLLTEDRAPFEDLFLLYVATDRVRDAFVIAQRATARSILDGLLDAERPDASVERTIARAGERIASARMLARALRASSPAALPAIADVLARLRGSHLLTYFHARGELWVLVLMRDGAMSARRIGGVAELAKRTEGWRVEPESVARADELGALLLPDEVMPPAGVPVFIVPDAPVGDVAFAALRRHGAMVIAHHAVAYAPSAAVLSYMRRSRVAKRAIVLGDPTGDLPEARKEAQEVAGALKVTPRLGREATKAMVLDANDATLIHIAAHAEPTAIGAALRMSDGLLDAGAVLDRGVSAGAIVLMTCSSAAAPSSDELAPLASAFIAAGAHTVIASRWAVQDDVARRFARLFYQGNGINDPVEAAAEAQRQLAAQHVPVAQWSSFVVQGGIP